MRAEEASARAGQATLLREERAQAALRVADLETALARKEAELAAEATRAGALLQGSQELAARCDSFEREQVETARRLSAAETEAARAKAAEERMSAIAGARREALIAELDTRLADAEALLQAQLSQNPGDAALHLQLGRLHHSWAEAAPEHEAIAERLLVRAAELDPYDATAPLYLGHVRLRRGQQGAARAAYGETICRDLHCAPAHEALALLSARSLRRHARIAFAAGAALLLASAGIFIHRLVQGPASRSEDASSESRERRGANEVVPSRWRE